MKRNSTLAMLLSAASAFCLVPILSDTARAQSLGTGWTYQYDAIGDGSGGKQYDIKGMAMSVQGDKLLVALMGGTPITGVKDAAARNGSIGWGDMFFNFSNRNFNDAMTTGQLFGVRFAASNDSTVGLGVYSNVQTTSVATQNVGYSSLQQYYTAGNRQFDKQNTQGSAISTSKAAMDYYSSGSIQNSIAAGKKVGDVNLLTMNNLLGLGLNFAGKTTDDTIFGFSIDKSALPNNNFLANVFLECGNDGMAFSSAAAAPEPTTMAGAAIGMAAIGGLKRVQRRRKQTVS